MSAEEKSMAGKAIEQQTTKTVPRSVVIAFLRAAGIDAEQVFDVTLTPSAIKAYGLDGTIQVVRITNQADL